MTLIKFLKDNFSFGWYVTWRISSVVLFVNVLFNFLFYSKGVLGYGAIIGLFSVLVFTNIFFPVWGYNYWGKAVIQKRIGYKIFGFIGDVIYFRILIFELFLSLIIILLLGLTGAEKLPPVMGIFLGGMVIILFVLVIVAYTGSLLRKKSEQSEKDKILDGVSILGGIYLGLSLITHNRQSRWHNGYLRIRIF